MKTIRNSLLLVTLVFLMTSCHPVTVVDLVNNTGLPLRVISIDTELGEKSYSVEAGETARMAVPFKLRVEHGAVRWDYHLPAAALPETFRKRIGLNRYVVKYQIQSDGTLCLISPDSEGPADSLPEQPPGYPIRPS
jgi:hypothetical protein